MTDRFKGLLVTLDEDIREDDAQDLINGIKMMRHVADVTGYKLDARDYTARMRIKIELQAKLLQVFEEELVKDEQTL